MTAPGVLIAGRYRLVDRVGAGGMGSVWEAWDELLQRRVAIKQLLPQPGLSADEAATARDRVIREARITARLHHPNAVTLYDVVEQDGRPCLIMQFVPSVTLSALVRVEGPIQPQFAARIGAELASALGAAHRVGIIHRDVKPGNVLITERGGVKLTDFGIAAVQGDPVRTTTGLVLGSPAYMAPEQARGVRVTPAADVWSLGATLYFAVEGVGPFERTQTLETLAAVLEEPPRVPDRAGPLAEPLAAALQKDAAARVTLAELRSLLEPVAARPPSAGGRAAPDTAYGPVESGPFPPAGVDEGGRRADPAGRPEPEDDEPGGLRDAAGRAAKELAPVVSALLAQHEARYPGLRRLRTALDGDDPHPAPPATSAAPSWSPEPGAAPVPSSAPRSAPHPAPHERRATPAPASTGSGMRMRLRQTWRVVRLLLWAVGLITVLLAGYIAFELFD